MRAKADFARLPNALASFKRHHENNSLFQKIKSDVCCARPARQEGRYGQSSPDAVRDAMDAVGARRSTKRVRRNRAVPIPRRWNQASYDGCEATVANKPCTPRRPRISRKPIAQGTPVVSAALWFLACVKVHSFCTQGSRVRPASGVPCALSMEGVRILHSPDGIAPRGRERVP